MNVLKITIIEDEKDHFDLMKQAIKKEFPDAAVHLYKKADLFLERLKKDDGDLVIADYFLPGMNGLELLEELKRRKVDIPFIMTTGQGDENIAVKAMKLGVFDYIVKSGSFFELIPEIIRKALNERELKAKVRQAEDEQKRLQIRLNQAQKMEAIGTLAGGIAHDFNNLLMGIQGRVSLMLIDINSKHRYFEHLKRIEDMIKRGGDLTRQLLGFARGGKYEVKPTDLNELIQKTSEMFGRTKKEIRIHIKYQKDIWTVKVDRGQIEQVLLNHYINACEAMSEMESGNLYLETKNVVLDKSYSKPFAVKPGSYVRISVTDEGAGMDEETRKRIFEPFFTTKQMGRGTGLGLASAYGIIKNHGGIINAYSEKDKGTTFNIYLPASEKDVIKEKHTHNEVLNGGETILLVDDEDIIIDVAREMLRAVGYEVLTAGCGKEAIEVYKKNKDKIDMVVLDMIMPDMGGGEAYDRLKEINPDIKALLSSGYSIDGQATRILERGCNGFIQKPFGLEELSQKIRKILDS